MPPPPAGPRPDRTARRYPAADAVLHIGFGMPSNTSGRSGITPTRQKWAWASSFTFSKGVEAPTLAPYTPFQRRNRPASTPSWAMRASASTASRTARGSRLSPPAAIRAQPDRAQSRSQKFLLMRPSLWRPGIQGLELPSSASWASSPMSWRRRYLPPQRGRLGLEAKLEDGVDTLHAQLLSGLAAAQSTPTVIRSMCRPAPSADFPGNTHHLFRLRVPRPQ